MSTKNGPFRRYLSKDFEQMTNIKVNRLMDECCLDYRQSDDEGKNLMLKTIITLLVKLLYGEDHLVNIDVDGHWWIEIIEFQMNNENMNITRLERGTKDIGTKLSQMFFHYYHIVDQKRKREIFSEILSYVFKLLMKGLKIRPDLEKE